MPQINGLITNSTGATLGGTLNVTLPSIATTDTTTPDTVYTPVTASFAITEGVVNISIPETETMGIAYRFSFTPTDDTAPLFEFDAIVPIAGPVEFATLIPTGITNRTLDTGALRVARLLAADPNLSQLIKQPAVFSSEFVGITTTTTRFVGKPFAGAILARSLTILGVSGYANWTFALGVLNSSGNEEVLTPVTSSQVIENGRLRRFQTYDISRAASVMGLFLRATPAGGAAALNATLSIAYSEVN